MEIQEFIKLRDENTVEYNRQLLNNSFDLKKFHGFDAKAGSLGRYVLAKKTHDILAAVALGFLPYLKENTGADAVKLVDGLFVTVEVKSSYTDIMKLFKNKNNTVYSTEDINLWADKVPKANIRSLKSCFNASYKIVNNLSSKFRDTCFVVVDNLTDEIVEAYEMDTNAMTIYLSERKIPESGNMSIKLVEFMSLGKPIDTVIPKLGFKVWEQSLLSSLPLKEVLNPKKVSRKQKTTNISLPVADSESDPKNDPSSQTSSPYSLMIEQQQTLDLEDIQPTSLFEIS